MNLYSLKAGVHMRAVLKALNSTVSGNILVTFQATLNLSAYFINHCLAVLCTFLDDFWAFWKLKEMFFSQRIG